MTYGVYPNSNGGATISGAGSGAGSPIPAGPDHVVRYALNSGPGLNIPAWAVYIALAHFSDHRGLSERTHREIADAIDAGSVSTVKTAIQHLEFFGKVEVTRRPGSTGGRNLPNVYRVIGEEFDWQPTPKGPREPGQIFAAYRRRHAEIEAEHRRSYEELEQSHRQREQDLLRRIGELEAAVNGHAPRQGEDAALSIGETPGSRETAIPPEPAPQPSPDTPGSPESPGNERPAPSDDSPPGVTAELPKEQGQELDSRETAIGPDPYPPQEEQGDEDEVDLLTREFWPWIRGKWDDINNAIHWYKRNRGEWTRQLKNARAAREAEERRQAKPGDRADRHRPGYEPGIRTGIRTGRGGNRESPGLGHQHTGRPRGQVAVGRGAGRPAAEAAPPDLRNVAETNGGRGLPGRPVHRGRPDSLRRGVAGKENVPRIAERPGKGGRPRAATAAAGPGGPWRR